MSSSTANSRTIAYTKGTANIGGTLSEKFMEEQAKHNKLIMEQFSKQAVPFSQKVPAHSNEMAFKLILETVGIDENDQVLDVACGPGMLTCAVAQKAKCVIGMDLVPAMIEQARLLQQARGLSNLSWKTGDVTQLPFEDAFFSAVMTRFSFHHFLKPEDVLREMVRVAESNGKIGVIDVFSTSEAHADLHDRMETLRDDSHVRVLSLPELKRISKDAGVTSLKSAFYRLEIELEQQLAASFPKPGDVHKIRQLVKNDTEGLISCQREGRYYLVYPIAIIAGRKT